MQEIKHELQKQRKLQKDINHINTLKKEITHLTQKISQNQ